MKVNFKKIFAVLFLVAALAMIVAVPVLAKGITEAVLLQAGTPDTPVFDLTDVATIVLQFAQLGGIAGLIAAIINALKTFGLPDGSAGSWSAVLNLLGLGGMIYLHYFQPTIGVAFIDAQAALAAKILLALVGYFIQLKTSLSVHKTLVALEVPVVGASHQAGTV